MYGTMRGSAMRLYGIMGYGIMRGRATRVHGTMRGGGMGLYGFTVKVGAVMVTDDSEEIKDNCANCQM